MKRGQEVKNKWFYLLAEKERKDRSEKGRKRESEREREREGERDREERETLKIPSAFFCELP